MWFICVFSLFFSFSIFFASYFASFFYLCRLSCLLLLIFCLFVVFTGASSFFFLFFLCLQQNVDSACALILCSDFLLSLSLSFLLSVASILVLCVNLRIMPLCLRELCSLYFFFTSSQAARIFLKDKESHWACEKCGERERKRDWIMLHVIGLAFAIKHVWWSWIRDILISEYALGATKKNELTQLDGIPQLSRDGKNKNCWT